MIGTQRRLPVGTRTVPVLVVDPNCPTIRNISGWEEDVSFEGFWDYMRDGLGIEKLLVTPTDPVMMVIMWSTYPQFVGEGVKWPKQRYRDLIEWCEKKAKAAILRGKPAWLTEGF